MAKQTQETARKAAQAKYVEGCDLLRAEEFDAAIIAFREASNEVVNDDSITNKVCCCSLTGPSLPFLIFSDVLSFSCIQYCTAGISGRRPS